MSDLIEAIRRLRAELRDMPPPEIPTIDPEVVPPKEAVRITSKWNRDFSKWALAYNSKVEELEALVEKTKGENP